MVSVSQGLLSGGATHLAIICNTAHHFLPEVLKSIPNAKFLNMVHLTLAYVEKISKSTRVGFFATKATIQTSMYQDVVKQYFDLQIVSPMDSHHGETEQNKIENVIFGAEGIKAGFDSAERNEESRQNLKVLLQIALDFARQFELKIIILACSELPLLLNEDTISRFANELFPDSKDQSDLKKIKFIDPGRVVCHEVLRMTLTSRS